MTERLITATDRLADYPRLYETDERYGEGVRRIRGPLGIRKFSHAKRIELNEWLHPSQLTH